MDISGKPTVISTFAGTGGSSLGYHWAGFKELLAIDFDSHAVECFKLNFPDVPIWKRSVIEVTGQEILDFCKIEKGELDVFDGSPPCQGFSTAGKREVSDPRNDLFNHYWRLVDELRPKVFVMENVSGMAKGTMKGKFIEIIKTLKNGNYNVKCKQMNAMYYGVPQSRVRLIFMGIRKDLNKEAQFPLASKKYITVANAFKDIDNSKQELIPIPLINNDISKILRQLKAGECASKYHAKGHLFGHVKLSLNRPSPTITKTGMAGKYPKFIHPSEGRQLTIMEAKRLCSFPDSWKLPGTFNDQWARLGNAVMPKFMQAIAETIKTEILNGQAP